MIRKKLLAICAGAMMLAASVLSGCGNSDGGSSKTTDKGVTADDGAKFDVYETQYFTKSTNPDSLGILLGDNSKDSVKKFSAVMKITYPDIAKELVGVNLPGNSKAGRQIKNDTIMAAVASDSPSIYTNEALNESRPDNYYKYKMVSAFCTYELKNNYRSYVIAEQDDDTLGWCLYAASEENAQKNAYYIAYRIPDTADTKRVHEFKVYVNNRVIEGASNPDSLDKYKEVYNWCKEHVIFGVAQSDISNTVIEGISFVDNDDVTRPGAVYKDAYGNDLGSDYVMGQDVYVKALSDEYNINIPNAQLSFDAYDDVRIKEDLNKLHNLNTDLYKIRSTYSIVKNMDSVQRTALENYDDVCDIQINGDTYKLVKKPDKDVYAAYRDTDDNVTICIGYQLVSNSSKGASDSGILNKDDVINGIKMIYSK